MLGTIKTDQKGSGQLTVTQVPATALSQWVAVWETVLKILPDGKWDVRGQLLCAWNPFFVPTP